MKKIFFTVGPTQTFPKLQDCINDAFANDIPSISHRGAEFQKIFEHTVSSIKKLLGVPDGFHVFFLGSATEAMERIVENCVAAQSFHFVNGAFSKKFFSIAKDLGMQAEALEMEEGEGFDLKNTNIPAGAELVCFTHNETSSGVQIPLTEIYRLKKKHPKKIFALDIVSSAPYASLDFSQLDCVFFSVQKGFGMPAGLGVLIVNDRAIRRSEELKAHGMNIGSFHTFPSLLTYARKNQTPATPNVLGIYLLGRISDAYREYGVERIRKETDEKANYVYDFFDSHAEYAPLVQKSGWRSATTIVIRTPSGSAPVMRKLAEHGFVVSSGYGKSKDAHIRIANFPMHTLRDMKRMMKVLK